MTIDDKTPFYQMEALHFDFNASFGKNRAVRTIRLDHVTEVTPVGGSGKIHYCEHCFELYYINEYREIGYWDSDVK